MADKRVHYRTCNLCEAMCGLEIELEDEKILAIRGDKNDPFSKGHICPKATALQDIYNDKDRLKFPLRRTESGWEQISWDEAFTEVVQNLKAVQAKYGNDAVGIYLGNPNVHNYGSMLYGSPFIRSLRTKNRFSATSVDQLPHHFAAFFMFGHQLLMPVPDIDHTDYMLIFGANPFASNGSLMTAAGVGDRLKNIQKRGGKFIVIDPRRTETASKADEHIFIRPGMDVLLLLAMVNTLFAENLVDTGHLSAMIDGLETVRQVTSEFTAERVAPFTGIAADDIRRLAHEFATAKSAVCYGRIGVSTQAFGGVSNWLINVLNIISGNLDSRGGAMFTLPAVDIVGMTSMTGQKGKFNRWRSRVRDLPEFGGELPVSVLAEEILTEGDGQIKAMVTAAGNPVLSTPNGKQLDEGLENLEYMVSIDIYINETTRHANIILPPTTGLETDHYDLVFHYLAVRNTAKFSPALYEPEDGTMHDWEILRELRIRMEANGEPQKTHRKDYLRRLPPHKIIDMALRFGPYGAWGGKPLAGDGVTLPKLKREVHGVDFGALQPCLKQRIATEDGKIHLAPEIIVNDLERVSETLLDDNNATNEAYPLALIGRRHLRSNNSWMHNSERLVRGKDRCTLMIHPEDAQMLGIHDGECVQVESRVGKVAINAEVTPDIMRGVVSIPHGWGHGRKGVQLETAQQYAGVSINDLTDDQRLDALTGNAAFNGVPVRVAALQAQP